MAFRDGTEVPAANEWGQYRAKMAQRGVPQAWINLYAGVSVNGRTRKQCEEDVSNGYIMGQMDTAIYSALVGMEAEGFTTSMSAPDDITIDGHQILLAYLLGCDYSALPNPLRTKLTMYMQSQGYCP